MFDFAGNFWLIWSDHDAHAGTHQGALGVERLSVSASASLLLCLAFFLRVLEESGVILDLGEVRVHSFLCLLHIASLRNICYMIQSELNIISFKYVVEHRR
jgi:hypothetical protein